MGLCASQGMKPAIWRFGVSSQRWSMTCTLHRRFQACFDIQNTGEGFLDTFEYIDYEIMILRNLTLIQFAFQVILILL